MFTKTFSSNFDFFLIGKVFSSKCVLSLFYGEKKRVSDKMYFTDTLQPECMTTGVLCARGWPAPSMHRKERPLSWSGRGRLGPSGVLGW